MLKRLGVLICAVSLCSGSALLAIASPAAATSPATSGSPQQNYVYGLYADFLTDGGCGSELTLSFVPLNYGPPSKLSATCIARTPDTTALAYYAGQLGLATSTIPPTTAAMTSVVNQVIGSAEYRNDLVTTAYNCYLGRPGDATGIAYYDALKGVTVNTLAASMLSSTELFNDTVNSANGTNSTYGYNSPWCGETQAEYFPTSNQPFTNPPNGNFDTWLANVYSVLLGRSVDPAGKTYYDAQYIKGVSLSAIVTSILNSTEFETDQVSNFYTHLLRRDLVANPDPSGVAYWVAQMKGGAGLTPEQVFAGITSTAEYWAFTQSPNNQ